MLAVRCGKMWLNNSKQNEALKAMKTNKKVASERAMAKAHGGAWCMSSLVMLPHKMFIQFSLSCFFK